MGTKAQCHVCGKRGRLFGPRISVCPGCEKEVCDACAKQSGWTVMTGTDHMTDYQDRAVCSEECAFNAYTKHLPRLVAREDVQLANEDNVSVGVYDREGGGGFGISIAYRHIDAGAWSSRDHMAPQASAMYERIKADLGSRSVKYAEIFESII